MNAHRYIGVYGICARHNNLLIIIKNLGPHIGRYDLPGGSVEPNESLLSALKREFDEEVGMITCSITPVGVRDFFVRWERTDYTQYGVLKTWHVSAQGTHLDGRKISDVALDRVWNENQCGISVKIGVKPDAKNIGGLNLFGRRFGNYEVGLVMRLGYEQD